MNRFSSFTFCILLCSYSLLTSAQEGWDEMKKKNFQINIPEGYIDTIYSNCFDDNRVLFSALSCSNAIESESGEVTLFFGIFPTLEKHYKLNRPHPDEMHRYKIRENLAWTLMKSRYYVSAEDWKECVTYEPSIYARRIYNADTIMTYHFWPKEAPVLYRDKYIGSQTIIGQKNGKGYFSIHCFYTEKGKENLEKHLADIEGIIRFRKD